MGDQLVGADGLVTILRDDTGEQVVMPRDQLQNRDGPGVLIPPGGVIKLLLMRGYRFLDLPCYSTDYVGSSRYIFRIHFGGKLKKTKYKIGTYL